MKRSLLETAAIAVMAAIFSASMTISIEAASSTINQRHTSPSVEPTRVPKIRKPHGLATIICGANPRDTRCVCQGGRRILGGTCYGETCFVRWGVNIDCADLNVDGGKL